MLKIENLTIGYGSEEPAVKNFSLHLKQGEILSIVGESGSGKSTVVRSVMGILPDSAKIISGTIEFQNRPLLHLKRKQWDELRAKEISMIFQDSNNAFNPIRTIGSIFSEYLRTHKDMSNKAAREKALEMLVKMKLHDCEGIMKSYPFQLSGGMRQRVSIAMAMSFTPNLLLADEPTSALDVTMQAQIVRQMRQLNEIYGTSIIMVTHNMGVAVHVSDRIIVMKDGEIAEEGRPEKIINHPAHPYTAGLIASVPELEAADYAV